MRITLLLLVLLAGSALAGQTVWKWVDDKGVTHYSDRAVPGATRMELSTGGNASSPQPAPSTPDSGNTAPADSGPPYTDLEIWQPGENETIANTGGTVTVNVRLQPGLQASHSLFLYLDGRLVEGYPGNTTSFDLREVPRGMHTLIAVVNDSSGKRVQESAAVTFHVRQESAAQPPVGPNLRPSPKPRLPTNPKGP